MKKLCALVLCVLMVGMMASTAFAASGTQISVQASQTTVHRGDEIKIVVSISSDVAFSSVGFIPNFNSEYFTVVSGELCPAGDDAFVKVCNTTQGGALAWMGAAVRSGEMFIYTLKIKDDAPFGSFKVTSQARAKNGSADIPVQLVESTITVECVHSYGDWTNKDAADHKQACVHCGAEKTAAHTWDAGKVTTEPTCKDEGVKTYTCADCGATKTEAVAKTTDHTYGKWTEKDAANHEKACTVCGKTETAAHKWNAGEVTTKPTCKDEGVKTYTCTDCGATKTESVAKTTDHTYGKWTEKDAANHEKACTVCGKTETAAHKWDAGKVTTEPDCKNTGVKTYTCADCGATKTETVPSTGNHGYGKWVKVDGEKHERACTGCGEKQTAAHTWDAGKVTTEPTCKDEGVKTYTCADCGATKTEAVPTTDVHTYGKWVKADDEKHEKACEICGKKETAAHAWDEGKVTTEPTCKDEGVKTYTCADCGATKTEEIPTVAHTYDKFNKVNDENHEKICSVCGNKEAEKHVHDAFGSDATNHWNVCKCGAQKDVVAHTFAEKWSADENEHYHACECGAKADAAAHEWDEGKVTEAATTEKEGVKTYTCKVCAATKTEKIEKIPASGNPITGENGLMIPVVLLMVLSAFGLALAVIGRKRNAR